MSLRRLLDAVPLLVASCDRAGRYTHVNLAYAARFGRTPEELLGRSMRETIGAAAFEEIVPLIERVLAGERVQAELTLAYPELGVQTLRSVLTPVRDADGAVIGWDGVGENVTEQRRGEAQLADASRSRDEALLGFRELAERLRAALDASETGTFRWNFRTNELDWDENLDRLFGLVPGTTARSLSEFISLVHPDDRPRVIAACERCCAEGADFEEEFRVVWPDGSAHWLYDKGRAHPGDDGAPEYMTGACVDVTDRRRKEDALREADRQKDEFIGVLAHELRSPLASLVFAVASLERRIADPAFLRPLQVMERQVGRITRLVDDLLDVSRVAQGKIVLERRPVDLAVLLRDAIEVVRPGLTAHRHTIDTVLEPGLVIIGDVDRLGQVFENLLANAVKYTPDGGRIVVRLRRDGDVAVTTVRDTGIGIAPDMLPQVFRLFVQAEESLTRSQGGLGIGLTLVERLTRLHGGSVTAHSDGLHQGAEFVVSLPLAGAPSLEPLLLEDGSQSLA